MTYFRTGYTALSSALRRFTVLFGMGRSGSSALLPPGNSVDRDAPVGRTSVLFGLQRSRMGMAVCSGSEGHPLKVEHSPIRREEDSMGMQ